MTELLNILRQHAAHDRPALIEACSGRPESVATYHDLLIHAQLLREALPREPGRVNPPIVAILSDSPLRQAMIAVAAVANGMIVNVINTALSPAMLKGQLSHARPDLLLLDGVENAPVELPDDCRTIRWGRLFLNAADTALADESDYLPNEGGLLIYTSGTTGTPKGVFQHWRHISANVLHAIGALGMTRGWIAGSVLPRFHAFTLISDLFPTLLLGGRTVLLDSFELSHVEHIVDVFRRHGVQSYSAAPTILETFCTLNAWHNTPSLRFAASGAAPLKERTRQEYSALFGHEIIPCYGLTETTCFATISPPNAIRPHSAGTAAGIDIRVLGDDGKALSPGARRRVCRVGRPGVESQGDRACTH